MDSYNTPIFGNMESQFYSLNQYHQYNQYNQYNQCNQYNLYSPIGSNFFYCLPTIDTDFFNCYPMHTDFFNSSQNKYMLLNAKNKQKKQNNHSREIKQIKQGTYLYDEKMPDFNISTITALFTLKMNQDSVLNLKEISIKLSSLKKIKNKIRGIIHDPKNKASGSHTKFGFPNVISLKIIIKKELISLNIFANGKIKISGTNSYTQCIEVAKKITSILMHCSLDVLGYKDLTPVLVKYECQLEEKVDLQKLYNLLNSCNYSVEYEPLKYNGLKLKTPDNIKIIVFSSGKCFTTSNVYDDLTMKNAIDWVQNKVNLLQSEFSNGYNGDNEFDENLSSQFLI